VSKSDPPPPTFILPGDDPKLDALLEKLREDSEDGDPFYVNYRKLEQKKQHDPEEKKDGLQAASSTGGAGSSTAPVATPDAVEVHGGHSNDVPARAPSRSPRVLWFLALAIVTPAITLALGALWVEMKDPGTARAATSNEAASAVVSAAPPPVPMPTPAAPTTAAIEAATAVTAPPPAVPAAPTSEPDAGAARVPAAPPNGRIRPQPRPNATASSAPHAGSGDSDNPWLN
jgi:hypothetical protein